MIIFKSDGPSYSDNMHYIAGAGKAGKYGNDTWIEFTNVEAGTYYIFVDIHWLDKTPGDSRYFTTCVYGKAEVTIDENAFNGELGIDRSKFLETIFMNKAQ
jgi:hypothetical protein